MQDQSQTIKKTFKITREKIGPYREANWPKKA